MADNADRCEGCVFSRSLPDEWRCEAEWTRGEDLSGDCPHFEALSTNSHKSQMDSHTASPNTVPPEDRSRHATESHIGLSPSSWPETLSTVRFEYRRQVWVLVFACAILLGSIPCVWLAWDSHWAGMGYLALGWFAALVSFELTKIQGKPTEKRLATALVVCIFVGVFLWGYIGSNEAGGLSFFGLLAATFLIHAERWRRKKKRAYDELLAWNSFATTR